MPKICEEQNCKNKATLGIDANKPLRCKEHPLDGMKPVAGKCTICGKGYPTFNYIGEKKRKWCVFCKPDDPKIVDIKSKMCPCGTTANFGYEKDKIMIACKRCFKFGMLNLKAKKCKCGSGLIPVLGNPDDKTKIYCSKCKPEDSEDIDIVNIKASKCKFGDDNMVNIKEEKKVLNSKCGKSITFKTKIKEFKIKEYIGEHFDGFTHNNLYKSGYNLQKMIDTTMLCIDVDDQKDKEIKYNDLLCTIYSGKWIFIRINPNECIVKGIKKNIKR
jgi:hypothetical protein